MSKSSQPAMSGSIDDRVLRRVVQQESPTVEAVVEIGEEWELKAPTTALRVLAFAEQVACLTLELLRTLPTSTGCIYDGRHRVCDCSGGERCEFHTAKSQASPGRPPE